MKNILLLDLWTDSNRGDCALQCGLISMVRDRWPGATITGMFRFGTNEFASAADEISFTSARLDHRCGGFRRTYYSAQNFGRFSLKTRKLLSLFSFFEMAALLLLYKLRLRMLLPTAKREVLDHIANADLVIWKGKNFREYGGLAGFNRQLTLLSAGMLASTLNTNLHCVNASVWPMKNATERRMVRWTFGRCRSVSVREPYSLDAMKQLRLTKVEMHFAQDLSFYCLQRDHGASGAARAGFTKQYDVAFTITQWGGAREQQFYLATLTRSVERLTAAGARRFIVVPQVTRAAEPNDALVDALTGLIQSIPGASIEVMPGRPDIEMLLRAYERAGLLIGTRMHSCVFAMAVGTPFVAIAYDAGPKWDILKQFWPSRFVFEYGSDGETVATAAAELFTSPSAIVKEAGQRFKPLAAQSFENVAHI